MQALVSPNEVVLDPNTEVVLGQRVAQVAAEGFPVARPLFWMDCPNEVVADFFYYDPQDMQFKPVPEQVVPEQNAEQPVQTGAEEL